MSMTSVIRKTRAMDASDLDNLTEFADYILKICSFERSNFQTKSLKHRMDATKDGATKDFPC